MHCLNCGTETPDGLASGPSCGAAVEFKSVVSVLAVCDYCQSTLVRNGEELENLGKMAELVEDRSPLQRGAEGRWQGVHFGLIGRIQLKYEQGLWNEWHLLSITARAGGCRRLADGTGSVEHIRDKIIAALAGKTR